MRSYNRLVAVAAAGIVVWSATAEAEGTSDVSPKTNVSEPAAMPPEPPAPERKPLMSALDQVGLAQPLDELRLNIYGYTEAGYFYDLSAPHSDGPTFIGFNNFKNEVVLNKTSLNLERTVDATKKQFDWGFH